MTRKWVVLGSFVVIVIAISAAAIAGTSPGQKGQFEHILNRASGDSDVIAIVEGKEVTRGEIRQRADYLQAVDPSFTNEPAVRALIVGVIDRFIIQAEVERRGLVPTEAEAEAFMQPRKDACLGPKGEECRENMRQLGLTFDEYWDYALPEYRKRLGKDNLLKAVFEEINSRDADNEQILNLSDTFEAELRAEAVITWKDVELGGLFQEALESW